MEVLQRKVKNSSEFQQEELHLKVWRLNDMLLNDKWVI